MTSRFLLKAVAACALLLPTVRATAATVYSAGHADFGVAYEDDSEWFVHYHFGTDAVLDGSELGSDADSYEFDPAEIQILVPMSASLTLGSTVPFLGNAPGSTIWVLSQTPIAGEPYFGLATEELTNGDWIGNIRIELTGFTGPGNFAVWSSGVFGEANVKMRTNDGVSSTDFEALPTGTHAHYNWGFTEPGIYQAEITVSGTHVTNGFQSSTKTMEFNVVPEPSSMLLGAIGGLVLVLRRKRSSNQL